ncbi:MAG: hypothetical protein ACREQV_17680 [Candidatus Binatia bacterium]
MRGDFSEEKGENEASGQHRKGDKNFFHPASLELCLRRQSGLQPASLE